LARVRFIPPFTNELRSGSMSQLSSAVLEAFKEFDSPTIFNAVVLKLGLPNEDYTDHQIRCLLPELVPVIGYAVTVEVTSNDADSVAVPWEDYYEQIDAMQGPHGVFNATRVNAPVTVGQVRVRPGDLIFGDGDGCVRIPVQYAEEVLALAGTVRAKEADIFAFYDSQGFSFEAWKASRK
jgi:regulator of RNase E activity RraA